MLSPLTFCAVFCFTLTTKFSLNHFSWKLLLITPLRIFFSSSRLVLLAWKWKNLMGAIFRLTLTSSSVSMHYWTIPWTLRCQSPCKDRTENVVSISFSSSSPYPYYSPPPLQIHIVITVIIIIIWKQNCGDFFFFFFLLHKIYFHHCDSL